MQRRCASARVDGVACEATGHPDPDGDTRVGGDDVGRIEGADANARR